MHATWSPRAGFGSAAERWCARLSEPANVIACEPAFAAQALYQAYLTRKSGRRFYASIYLADAYASFVYSILPQFTQQCATLDEWRAPLDAIAERKLEVGDRTVDDVLKYSDETIAQLTDLVKLSDGVLVRSWSEYARLQILLGPLTRDAIVVLPPESAVPLPPVPPSAGSEIVVWGANLTSHQLALFAVVAEEMGYPMTLVCEDAGPWLVRTPCIAPSAGSVALARANVIVDATLGDPASAVALAQWKKPLLVPSANGIHEFLDGAISYDPFDRLSLVRALNTALGAVPPTQKHAQVAQDAPPVDIIVLPEVRPLVSVVVCTYNRRDTLAEALESIRAQTYDPIEVIVVNDAGIDVRDIVEPFGYKLVTNERNLGPAGATNVGMRVARGEYITFLDDDDLYLADHVNVMVSSLLRSGLRIAGGNALTQSLAPAAAGGYEIVGLRVWDAVFERPDVLWQSRLVACAVMLHRSLIEEYGYFDEVLDFAIDYEYWLRIAQRDPVVRPALVTTIYSLRTDNTNRSNARAAQFAAAHQTIYERFPAPGRPLIEAKRRETLETLARRR